MEVIDSGNGLAPNRRKVISGTNDDLSTDAFIRQSAAIRSWWRHQMETFSALLAICAGNSSVPGEFPAQRPVTRNFDIFVYLRLNKRLRKQSWGWWFETLSRPLWRHCNVTTVRVWVCASAPACTVSVITVFFQMKNSCVFQANGSQFES